jgi:biopolymer transport protein ExbB
MMTLTDSLFRIELLMESGGTVLWMILFASILMWTLIVERYLYVYIQHPRKMKQLIDEWHERADRSSWFAHRIREGLIAENRIELERYLMVIKTLTVALPMLGLLGTVDGMIQTFDVLSVFGTGNVRGMAGGISIALITTMAGLVTALSGLYFSTHLSQRVSREVGNIADSLRQD